MTIALKQAGAIVTAVPSIKAALQALVEIQPNVLISDATLPDEDGYSLIEQIQLLHPDLLNEIPAIALTNFAMKRLRMRRLRMRRLSIKLWQQDISARLANLLTP